MKEMEEMMEMFKVMAEQAAGTPDCEGVKAYAKKHIVKMEGGTMATVYTGWDGDTEAERFGFYNVNLTESIMADIRLAGEQHKKNGWLFYALADKMDAVNSAVLAMLDDRDEGVWFDPLDMALLTDALRALNDLIKSLGGMDAPVADRVFDTVFCALFRLEYISRFIANISIGQAADMRDMASRRADVPKEKASAMQALCRFEYDIINMASDAMPFSAEADMYARILRAAEKTAEMDEAGELEAFLAGNGFSL